MSTAPSSRGSWSSAATSEPSFAFCIVTMTRSPGFRIFDATVAPVHVTVAFGSARVREPTRTSAPAGVSFMTTPRSAAPSSIFAFSQVGST